MMIEDFYKNKSILITGATGFLGKVLLEKVMRSLTVVKTIYLGINAKGDNNAEYGRFKKEIQDSLVFDRLKTELGNKEFKRIIKQKVRPIAMDLSKDDLGLSDNDRETFIRDLNIIINCAGNVEFDTRLDQAVKINVTGPLNLLKLAEQAQQFTCFCQVSSCYAMMDKDGLIEEKMLNSPVDWQAIYKQVSKMTLIDIEHYGKTIMGNFANTYVFTKRMAEHLLVENNSKNIPMLIIRPSIIGASLEEPTPGWTDSIGLMGGIYFKVRIFQSKQLQSFDQFFQDKLLYKFKQR